MQTKLAYYSAQGNRQRNEDSVSVLEFGNSVLAMVADGLGGLGRGEEASRALIASVNSDLQNKPVTEAGVCSAVRRANSSILAMQTEEERMQSTIALLWFNQHTAVAANVGDSRVYQFRDGKIIFQSIDHSTAQIAVMLGDLKAEQIREFPDRSRLVRAVGLSEDLSVDTNLLQFRPGDSFLLCTDGFWEHITEPDMCYYLQHSDNVRDWLRKMRDYVDANAAKKPENNSAIVIGIE